MSDEGVGCVPIVEDEESVGIVTDRKIALSLADVIEEQSPRL
ncbi:CBS domain-containing protein [Haladaptatus pallidirubidus]|uniref:CBS domain-containing protein n=1 Tax=Haladaptatus pallidirubidus TaxID=1008152 RepID=A0AAV3UMM0_9EURY|nr:CBS domain-containing protein [Haladaptatus pallidirubidus]